MPLEKNGKPKLLILGSSGYLGSFLVDFFYERKWNVVSASRSPLSENLYVNHVNFFSLTIKQRREVLQDIDFVINCAASSARSADSDRHSALLNDLSVIDTVVSARPLPKNLTFVNMSSVKVYGDHTEAGTISEKSELKSTSNYGLNKIQIENLLIESARKNQFKYLNLRVSNLFGAPGRLCESQEPEILVVNSFVKTALREGIITIQSPPATTRDFLPLETFGPTLYEILIKIEDIGSGSFNVCSGIQTPIYSLAELVVAGVFKTLQKKVRIILTNEKGHEHYLKSDIRFSQRKLNQHGIIIPNSFESAVFDLILTYAKHVR